ncbi:MAG: hypothetical protein ACLFQB_13070 [Chitinispirillaceae bacterium]
MISSEKTFLIDKYLSGRLEGEEFSLLRNLIAQNETFRKEVDQRTSFEADLFTMGMISGEAEEEKAVEDFLVDSPVLAPTRKELKAEEGEFSEDDWESIIDGAFDTVRNAGQKKNTPFRRYFKYLLAACLVAMVTAGYVARAFYFEHIKEETKNDFESFQKSQTSGKAIESDTIMPHENGAVLVEQNSIAEVGHSADAFRELKLVRGKLLIVSQGESEKEFRVVTPQVQLTYAKVVASIRAEKDMTVISVDSGSVKLNTGDGRVREVHAPSSVVAGQDSVISFKPGFDVGEVRKRQLLENFLNRTVIDISVTGFGTDGEIIEKKTESDSVSALFDGNKGPREIASVFRKLHDSLHTYENISAFISRHVSGNTGSALAILDSLEVIIQDISALQLIFLRSGDVSLGLGDTASALKKFRAAFDLAWDGLSGAQSLDRILKVGNAESYGTNRDSIAGVYLKMSPDDIGGQEVVLSYANSIRKEKEDYQRAIKLYDGFIKAFPESRYREDAMYWIGWCIIEEKVSGRRSGIDRKKLLRPDGHIFR